MAVMNRMRENTKTILMILVVAFMLTIIIDWGMGGFKRRQPRGVIASVGHDDITYEEFYNRYQNEIRAYREQNGTDPEGYQLQQIENRVFENLVQQRLLSHLVDKMKLDATDDEIVDEIFNNPPEFLKQEEAFKDSNGVFDMKKYQAALQNPAANWLPIENYIRSVLPMQKLAQLINATVIVTDEDAKLEFMKRNLKAKIEYIFYSAANFAKTAPEPTEEEIKAYYEKHKKEYDEPEKRVVEYILLETKPTKADTEATYKEANDLIKELKSGGDFEQLAKLYSQDPGSAEKGGDLGYFSKGTMVKEFEEAAFAAKKGEIVGPVKTQYGLHIIKVEDRKREKGQLKVKARHILLKFQASPSTKEALRDEANYIAEYAKDSDLVTVVKSESLEVQKTPPFAEGGFIPGIGMEPRVSRFIFRSKKGTVSDVFQLDRGFLVLSIADIIPEHIKPLEEVRPQIVTILKKEKEMDLARAQCEAAYEKIKAGATIDEVANEDSLKSQQTDFFTMSGYIPGIGREPELVGTAFKLEVGEYAPVRGTRGYYLIQLLDKTEFDQQAFEKQKELIKQQLIQQKKAQLFNKWYADLREKAKIKDFRKDYL